MLRAALRCACKAGTDFHTLDGVDPHHRRGEIGIETSVDGLSPADRDAGRDYGDLPEDTMARGPRVTKLAGSTVSWSDLLNRLTGKVPFLLRPAILKSDEAIVAVLGHEMYELAALREILNEGKTTIEHYIAHTCPDNLGNLHDQAWDYADRLVERMRSGKK